MILSEETKNKITTEYESFKKDMYGGKTLEQRKELDAFFTPSELTIQMIEKFDCDSLEEKTILDPCCGSGNLLAACLIAGANPKNIFGNDFDGDMVKVCRKRLKAICEELGKEGFKDHQIHQGNALQKRCVTEFNTTYEQNYKKKFIDDLDYAQGKYSWDKENKEAENRLLNSSLKEEELW